MNRIIIVGARKDGHAKVVLEILLAQKLYEVVGFVDDGLYGKLSDIRGYPVLGTMKDIPELIAKYQITCGIVAIGNNPIRRSLANQLIDYKLELVNAIHPTVHLDSDVTLGKGIVLCQNVTIVTGSIIGNCVNIHTGATVDHDNIISDGANLGPGVHTAGRVKIGQDAILGTGAIAIPDAHIGEGATVGAGAVVLKTIEPYTMAVGIPAKFVKYISK